MPAISTRFITLRTLFLLAIVLAMAPIPAARADDDDSTFRAAESLYGRAFYELAADQYKAYMAQAPEGPHNSEAWFKLGECRYQLKQWDKCVSALTHFLNIGGDEKEIAIAEVHRGDSEFNLEHFDGASASFRKATQDSHDNDLTAYASYWYAESLFRRGDKAAALKAYTDMLDRFPQYKLASFAVLSRGTCLAELGRHGEAAAAFRSYLQKYPKEDGAAEASFRLGAELYKQKDFAGSSTAYRRVIDEFPMSEYALPAGVGLAWSDEKAGQFADAAVLFESSAQANAGKREGEEAALHAGYCYAKMGDTARAEKAWRIVLSNPESPFHAEASYLLAKSLLDGKHYQDSAGAFRTFLDAHPEDARAGLAWAGLGDSLWALEKYSDATDAYQHAADLIHDRKLELAVLTGLLAADEKSGRSDAAASVRRRIKDQFPESGVATASALDDADGAFTSEKYLDALHGYQAFLKAHPDDADAPRAGYRALQSQLKLGQVAEAGKSAASLAAAYPRSPFAADGLLAAADAAFEAHNYSTAAAGYQSLLTDFGNSKAAPWAHYGRGSCRVQSHDWDGAHADFAAFAAALPRDPAAAEASFRLGWIREQQGRLDDASAEYAQCEQRYPDSVFACQSLFARGTVLSRLKKPEDAAACWAAVTARFPRSPLAPRALAAAGWQQLDGGRTAAAEPLLTRLVSDYPDSQDAPAALAELASMKLQSGDLASAGKLFDQFLQKYPHAPMADEVAFGAALVSYRKKDFASAGAAFRKAAMDYPQSKTGADSLFWAGDSFLKANDFPQALAQFTALLEKSPESPRAAAATLEAGQAQQGLKHFDEAAALFKKVGEMDKGALAASARCYLGECLLEQHKPREALLPLIEATASSDDPAVVEEAEFHVGMACEAMGDYTRASASYGKLARSETPSSWTRRAKERLDAIQTEHGQKNPVGKPEKP